MCHHKPELLLLHRRVAGHSLCLGEKLNKKKKKSCGYKRACDIVKYKGDVALNTRAVSLHLSTWRLAGEYEESRERERSHGRWPSRPCPARWISHTQWLYADHLLLYFFLFTNIYVHNRPATAGKRCIIGIRNQKISREKKGKQHFDRFLFFFFKF